MVGPRLPEGQSIEQRTALCLGRLHRALSNLVQEVETCTALINKMSVKADQLATSEKFAGKDLSLPGQQILPLK